MTALATALIFSVLFNAPLSLLPFFGRCNTFLRLPVLVLVLLLRLHIVLLRITVVFAIGSKPGTHSVPSELKLDAGGDLAKAYVCVHVHEEVNVHLWSSTLMPCQQPSAWEVELGDQHPSLRPGEIRFSSVYLLVLRWNRSGTRRE